MSDLMKQFFDKRGWWVLAGLLVAHLIAALVQSTMWSWLPLTMIGLGVFVASYKKLEWGLALAFLEIFIGGHGHLFDVNVGGFSLSVRMVIFAAVMTAYFVQIVQKRLKPQFIGYRDWPFAAIGTAIVLAAAVGFVSNEPRSAFDDMNGYLTLLYFFPMISLPWTNDQKRLLLQTLAISAVWIAGTTLIYLYAFTHLPGKASHLLYTFVRDARLAEITLLTNGRAISLLGNSPWYFRVFQQSQAVVAAFELVLLAGTLWFTKTMQKFSWPLVVIHILMIATILASLSRSFWIGSAVALVGMVILVASSRPHWITLGKRFSQLGLCTAMALLVLLGLVIVPLPPRPDLSQSSFYKPTDDNTREVAVTSRWNLLGPMVAEIKVHPMLGSGFGETVTYISDDPRLRAVDPTGEVTTYRFEWGFHDLWLKLGILGLFSYAWYLITLLSATIETVRQRDEQAWLALGLGSGLVALFITHIFSPYLNHPIGISLMILVLPFFSWKNERLVLSETTEINRSTLLNLRPMVKTEAGVAFKQHQI